MKTGNNPTPQANASQYILATHLAVSGVNHSRLRRCSNDDVNASSMTFRGATRQRPHTATFAAMMPMPIRSLGGVGMSSLYGSWSVDAARETRRSGGECAVDDAGLPFAVHGR